MAAVNKNKNRILKIEVKQCVDTLNRQAPYK